MELAQAAAEVLGPLGYEVLELDLGASGRSRRVLLRIDRLDEAVVSMDDVERASEVFGLELDRLDPFEEPYRLEVESPGSQRPLVTPRHFERFNGLLAKVRAGADTFVSGSGIFGTKDYAATIAAMKREIDRARGTIV